MKNSLTNLCFTIVFSMIVTTFTVFWLLNDVLVKSIIFYDDPEQSQLIEGITKVDTEFYDSRIYLNVHIDRPLTCNKVVNLLGVKPVTVKTKVYFPVCYNIDNKFVQIIYSVGTAT